MGVSPRDITMLRLLQSIARWFGDTFSHALGNPNERNPHPPPLVGMQPYSGDPHKH
jgi:hypothetical protein